MKVTNRGRPGLFAQLIGLGKNAAEDDEQDDKEKSKSKSKSEEEDEENPGAEDDDDGDEDQDKDKSKSKTNGDDGDDDTDAEDDEDDKKEARAALAERRRCAKIIAHGIKLGAVEQAGVLAFDSELSANVAISTLNSLGPQKPNGRGNLGSRMNDVRSPNVGTSGGGQAPASDSVQGVAARITGAYRKALGDNS